MFILQKYDRLQDHYKVLVWAAILFGIISIAFIGDAYINFMYTKAKMEKVAQAAVRYSELHKEHIIPKTSEQLIKRVTINKDESIDNNYYGPFLNYHEATDNSGNYYMIDDNCVYDSAGRKYPMPSSPMEDEDIKDPWQF